MLQMKNHPLILATPRHRVRGRGSAGTSLVETLIASALLLVVAVAIFPLFHRSVANNLSGSDSTQATQHGKSQLEGLLSIPFDSQMFDMANPLPGHTVTTDGLGDKMDIGTLLWDAEANTTDPIDPTDRRRRIASGSWIVNAADARGTIVWQRESVIRQYAYSDIAEGVIDITNPGQIVNTGHPQLFDNPLPKDAPTSAVNFKEEDVNLESQRPGVPSFRTRFWRTF